MCTPASLTMKESSGPARRKFNGTKTRAQLAAGEEHFEELRNVDREHRDPIAVADAEVGKARRTPVDLLD